MDDELRRIFSISAIGGLFGWVNAKSEVDEFCVIDDGTTYSWSEYENQCVGEGGWVVKNMAIDLVYPSSILTGLVLGFFLGVIYAAMGRFIEGEVEGARKPKKKIKIKSPKLMAHLPPSKSKKGSSLLIEKPIKLENFVCECGFSDPSGQVMIEHQKMCRWSKAGAGLESH